MRLQFYLRFIGLNCLTVFQVVLIKHPFTQFVKNFFRKIFDPVHGLTGSSYLGRLLYFENYAIIRFAPTYMRV
jgi:hypothetical protein